MVIEREEEYKDKHKDKFFTEKKVELMKNLTCDNDVLMNWNTVIDHNRNTPDDDCSTYPWYK